MGYHVYWLLKSSCSEFFVDGNYGLFWAKKLMERWYLLIIEKFLFWTFQWWEIRSFSEPKRRWKDDIYLVYFTFPWYSRTWEMWFFGQWKLKQLTINIFGKAQFILHKWHSNVPELEDNNSEKIETYAKAQLGVKRNETETFGLTWDKTANTLEVTFPK